MWRVKILTLFPEIYPGPLSYSKAGKAMERKLWALDAKNIRDFTNNKSKAVDSPPFGGGTGMLLRADAVGEAVEKFFLVNKNPIVYLSPKGALLKPSIARSIINSSSGVNILCGRFEGIDERIIKEYKMTEISIGDYVLSSGDIASFVFVDCCLRYLPGYFKDNRSVEEESYGENAYSHLLEHPHYTRPLVWKSLKVPPVLVSGHHQKIAKWRLEEAKKITKQRRQDLWIKHLNGVTNEPN